MCVNRCRKYCGDHVSTSDNTTNNNNNNKSIDRRRGMGTGMLVVNDDGKQ